MVYRINRHERTNSMTMAPAGRSGGGAMARNPGNFTNSPQRAAEAGRKGGQYGHGHEKS